MQRLTQVYRQFRWFRLVVAASVAALLAIGISTCNAPSDLYASSPPCTDSYCDCSDFANQALAQDVLTAFKDDPYGLDKDGNGQACESLPRTDLIVDRAADFSNSEHLTFGNPSNAARDNPNNFLVEREPYVLSYSKARNGLNWASWRVDKRWLGSVDRQDNFSPDGELPEGFYQVTPGDYRRSGYDRGHMVPSGDRTLTPRDNSLTFLMTNIFPQVSANNRGPWRELEQYGRDLVQQKGKALYVIGGIYGDSGKVGRVTVPSRVWKVIVVLDNVKDDITRRTEVIAVDMPNSDRIEANWQTYRTTVDRIEIATGYNLLSEVSESIQAVIESNVFR